MRLLLLLSATLTAFAVAGLVNGQPARATAPIAAVPIGVSDSETAPTVPPEAQRSERWHCTPTGCAGARPSSGSAALGFAATTLAALWISRQRPLRSF